MLYPARREDVLYTRLGPDSGDLQIQLDVDGCPRVFIYDVKRNNVMLARDLWRVRITEPLHDPIFAIQPRKSLHVAFRVDAPDASFFARGRHLPQDDFVRLNLFDERDPDPDNSYAQWFYSDRQITVELEEADAPGEMKVTAKVSDFSADVTTHGLEDARARIRAQLFHDGAPKTDDSVRVILDSKKPQFELAAAPSVNKGEKIRVAAADVDTLSGIRKFQYGFQGDAENQFKGDPKTVLAQSGSATVTLPTDELDPGKSYTILVCAENKALDAANKAGNTAFRTLNVAVVEPPPPRKPEDKGPPATITVHVTARNLAGQPAAGLEVTIENHGTAEAEPGQPGKYVFKDLPRGVYTVKAKGSVGSIPVTGTKTTPDPGSGDSVDVEIKVGRLQ